MYLSIMKKFAASLLILMLLASSCVAIGDAAIPAFGTHRTDAVPSDFIGSWALRWIDSEGPVDLSFYGNIEILPDQKVLAYRGNAEEELNWDAPAEEIGNGVLYVPGQNEENGIYIFLFNENIIGCTDTLEAPTTVFYYEFGYEITDENDERTEELHLAAMIFDHVGDQLTAPEAPDYTGKWCAFTCSNEMGSIYPVYLLGAEIEFFIEDAQATVSYRLGGEESVYNTPIVFEENHAMVMDEFGVEEQYLVLCADGRLALLDDLDTPQSVMFFLPEEEWLAEMADPDYVGTPVPGEQITIDSFDALSGDWIATHINYGGLIYAAMPMNMDETISIDADGLCSIGSDNTYIAEEAAIENGMMIIHDEDGDASYLLHFEPDFLIRTENPEDLSLVIYYQRMPSED